MQVDYTWVLRMMITCSEDVGGAERDGEEGGKWKPKDHDTKSTRKGEDGRERKA